jgi:hypothetical protein
MKTVGRCLHKRVKQMGIPGTYTDQFDFEMMNLRLMYRYLGSRRFGKMARKSSWMLDRYTLAVGNQV